MKQQELREGQLVQLNPETCRNPMFAACIIIACIALFFSVHSCGPTENEAALDVAADVADAQAAALIAAGTRK